MEQALQLFGYLIVAFLGFIAPILVILLSMFSEGRSKLSSQYENERLQSEKNIKEQLKKLAPTEKTDLAEIEQGISKLKAIKKTAESKLSYLNPKKQILRLFILLLISFLAVTQAMLNTTSISNLCISISISLICFTYAMVVLWKLLNTMIEVRKIIDDDKKEKDTQTINLLSALVEKQKMPFLRDVAITIDGQRMEGEMGTITFSVDKKQEVKIGISNRESRMAKNVQIGFIFPSDFIIEKTSRYSIYTDKEKQIVRYTTPLIHGNTKLALSPLIITPLKMDNYPIKTFIKAENIETIYRDLPLKVTGRTLAEIMSELPPE